MQVLTINVGSASVKLSIRRRGAAAPVAARKLARDDGAPEAQLRSLLADAAAGPLDAVVHRVVHGGARLVRSCLVDDAVEAELARVAELAPLHDPPALAWIRAARRALPSVPSVAAFDTAFFADLPEAARTYALPAALVEKHGLRRYGFHGLAHRSMWQTYVGGDGARARARVVTLQLGGGASAAALDGGRPVDTSMGFSPLEGLVMATRAGDVDPGLLVHLMRVEGLSPDALERLLDGESGLLGLSARTGDLRVLLGSDDARARLAVDVYCHRVRRYVGAFAAVLGGLDAVLVGGGVGEHLPAVRARALGGLDVLGLAVDDDANARATGGAPASFHAAGSRVEAWVIPVDEEALLEAEAWAVLDL